MILRPISALAVAGSSDAQARPSADVFIETEKHVEAPFAIIFQAEHSMLAGQLAVALAADAFGELPLEVMEATAQHDFGWNVSDETQMEELDRRSPRPFPDLSAAETLPSWNQSIAHARHMGPLFYVMVSRHFTLLGAGDASRAEFVAAENARRAEVERELPYSAADLDRWTGAVGFCDLLSLYLCCGSHETVEFPMTHPASPDSARARTTILSWQEGLPVFSPPMLKPQTRVTLSARSYSGDATDLMPVDFEWVFPKG